MKLSISLNEEQVASIDRYRRATGMTSRSAVVQRAIGLLDESELEEDYDSAWREWEASGDAESWDSAAADGLGDASR